MAKHEIAIHENTGTTKDKAPYLGSYITKGTVGTEGFVSALAAKCGLPTIQVQAILSGCIEAIEALEREELVRIHLDGFTVMGAITGTFDTSDAAFDPERNAFNLVLTPEPEIRNAVIDVQPTIVPDDIEGGTTIEFIVETAGGSTSRDGIEVDLYPPAP